MAKKPRQMLDEDLIRIFSTDIPSRMTIYAGLTRIKGISWVFSNAICKKLKLDKKKKVSELSDKEVNEITKFLENPKLPDWLYNRKKDPETGESTQLITTNLDLKQQFDIRGLKKIKCYRGVRHSQGQPVRGQRTRAHFRSGKSVGVQKTKKKGK
ncbi:MAG: 30S ribosomal protein S13 [archaeon]